MGSAERWQADRNKDWLKKISVFPGVYEPAEDTWLLLDYIEFLGSIGKLRGAKFLEIGCGCGVVSIRAAMLGANVLAVDINPLAVENTIQNAKKLGVELRAKVSDLFSNVDGTFDVVVFNPPYIPENPTHPASDPAWSGMEDMRTVKTFLRGVPKHLREDGVFGIVLSSLSDVDSLIEYAKNVGIDLVKRSARRFFFEEIYLLEGRRCL